MPRPLALFVAASVVAVTARPATAVNLFFMPGDAFFSSSLSEESAAALPAAGGTVMLKHYWLHDDMYFCGYAGFKELEIRDVPPEVATGLKTLYSELRRQGYWKEESIRTEDGKEERWETNPFHLFVYDKSFDPQRYEFGLKYNEKWADLPEDATGSLRADTKYEKFLSGEKAIIDDWRDAPRVARLPVDIPDGVRWASASAGHHPPVRAAAKDVRFFVLSHGELEAAYKAEAYTQFWEVTPTGFRRFDYLPVEHDWENTRLVATDVPFEQPQKLTEPLAEPDDMGTENASDADP